MKTRVVVNSVYATGFRQYHKPKPHAKSLKDFASDEGEFAGQKFILQSFTGGRWNNVSTAEA